MKALQPELFDDSLLLRRLQALGLVGVTGVECHENRSVLVSVTGRGVLRLHRAFAFAPDVVLEAIVRFVHPSTRRKVRVEAERRIVEYPVHRLVPPRRPRRRRAATAPRDRPLVEELRRRHRQLNDRHFAGSLTSIAIRVSRRMRTRLGELSMCPHSGRPLEIAVSHRHIARDGWNEAEQTLLHEMIHQWQAETGRAVDHGSIFRAKAREVGVAPRAARTIRPS